MKNLIKKIFNISLFSKQEEEEQEIEQDQQEYYSGQILIQFDSETSEFEINTDIKDLSDNSIETLSLFLLHLIQGNLISSVTKSIEEWAAKDQNKLDYNRKVGLYLQMLSNSINSKNQVAVSASKVFNFKGLD
ncbi:MAG: hypothetical protein HWN81_09520 [Candidatus Lokiarchaeota archaeon]|nr:hypothetical protein [Candidatus Lokiarchaeota archaeon]